MIKSVHRFHIKFYFLIFFSLTFQLKQLIGQIVVEEEMKRLYYDRTKRITKFTDMNDMRDVFHKDKFLLGKKRIMGNKSFNTGRILIDDGKETHEEWRAALGFYVRARFFEEFSVNATLYYDFNPRAAARWTSNYTYSIGRYNWRPGKFNYGYENYLNNRYTDDFKTFSDKFMQGYYFVSYGHELPQNLLKKITLDNTTNLKFIYFVRYSLKYEDHQKNIKGGLFDGKTSMGGGFRYTIFKNIYIESALYFYVDPSIKKAPWDPDFTYGFGYFDWRSFRLSVTYGNWAVNHFPWNKTDYPRYGFLDGNFRLTLNYIW